MLKNNFSLDFGVVAGEWKMYGFKALSGAAEQGGGGLLPPPPQEFKVGG